MTEAQQTADESRTAAGLERPVHVVALQSKLDVHAATKLKAQLATALGEGVAVTLEASGVARASTAACQVIAAFVLAMRQAGHVAVVNAPSASLSKSFAALGLDGFLNGKT